MDWQNLFHAFQFEKYVVVHNHVQTIATVELFILVDNRKRLLTNIEDSPDFKFMAQTLFVCRFKQTWSKVTVDFQCSGYNLTRSIFRNNAQLIHHSFPSWFPIGPYKIFHHEGTKITKRF